MAPVLQRNRAMNKFVALVVVAVLGFIVMCAYWYVRPQDTPRFVRELLPGYKAPALKSPVATFRPPSF